MAIRDDATLSEMAWELETKFVDLETRLAMLELGQAEAIRLQKEHRMMSYDALGGILIVLLLMWDGVEFKWWFAPIAMVALTSLYYVRAGSEIKGRARAQGASVNAEADPS